MVVYRRIGWLKAVVVAEGNVPEQIRRIRAELKKMNDLCWVLVGSAVITFPVAYALEIWGAGWYALLILAVPLFYMFSLNLYHWPYFGCPHCGARYFPLLDWTCGPCGHDNRRRALHTFFPYGHAFVDACSHCERMATGFLCSQCEKIIVFDEQAHSAEAFLATESWWQPLEVEETSVENETADQLSPSDQLRQHMGKTTDRQGVYDSEKKKLNELLASGKIDDDRYKFLLDDLDDAWFRIRTAAKDSL